MMHRTRSADTLVESLKLVNAVLNQANKKAQRNEICSGLFNCIDCKLGFFLRLCAVYKLGLKKPLRNVSGDGMSRQIGQKKRSL